MPLEHMVTAMSCLLSTCGSSNDTAFMRNSAILKPLDDVWGMGCRTKAADFNKKLTTLLSDQERTRNILDKLELSMKQLQSITGYKADERRGKRDVADYFDAMSYPQFNCNGSVTGIQKIQINAQMPSFLVSCEADNYGHGWLLMATLDATHRERLREKSRTELINGFGDNVSEYFIGLERLHSIAASNIANEMHQLLILTYTVQERSRTEGAISKHFMLYNSFALADASNDYRLLSLEGYAGDIVDPLNGLLGQPFSIAEMDLEGAAQMTMFVRSVKAR